jgi:hypothetical protein
VGDEQSGAGDIRAVQTCERSKRQPQRTLAWAGIAVIHGVGISLTCCHGRTGRSWATIALLQCLYHLEPSR